MRHHFRFIAGIPSPSPCRIRHRTSPSGHVAKPISCVLGTIFAMKLHTTPTQHYQTVTAYDRGGVEINAIRFESSLLVMPETAPVSWPPVSFDTLTVDDFKQIDAAMPEVVILGTGERQRFVHPKLTAPLTSRRVGVECMDNQAACRTYNILMAEGRKVALALIFERSLAD